MLVTFRSWDSFSQREGREILLSPDAISAIEGMESGGWEWSKVHLKSGSILNIADSATSIKARCKL